MKKSPILFYEKTGSGPIVVLLHGYMASSRYWQKVIARLSADHTVIAMDLLGFGSSPKPRHSKYDVQAQLDSIDATLKYIGVQEKFTLTGHSMGSIISLRYANRYPERLNKLVLTNMPVFASVHEAKQDIYGTRALYRFALKPGLHDIIWPFFKVITKGMLLFERVTGNLQEYRSYMFQSTGVSRIRSMRNLLFKTRIEADLVALQVSTVILSGLQDRKPYLKNLQQYRLSAHAHLENVLGGHHLPQTNPELVVQLIR